MASVPPWHLPPGSKDAFTVPVAVRADGSAVSLPVLVVRGATAGKTLLATAGVHGDEFEGMAALRHLYGELTPDGLTGTFVAVPVANPPAFEAGLRTNPDDRQDMARVFPGDLRGTITEQLAARLTEWIAAADFYCDLHSAGQYYRMPALVGYQLRPGVLEAQRAAARAFGMPLVWGTPGLPGRSLSAASEAGVPSLYVEITGEGRCRPEDVARYRRGLLNLLRHLGLREGIVDTEEPQWFVEDDRTQAGFLQIQNRAPVGGFFTPEVDVLTAVMRKQRLGTICDALGRVRHVVEAPHEGLVVFLRTFPRVLAGDPVCTVLQVDAVGGAHA
ncbi:MAG TPA: M14 family metallopeptidase [Gemmataceae bacterium]|nr:M14 family metallopeptidase [Gemmataceae bacterium]